MSKRKEIPTHSEIGDRVKELTVDIRHAKIDCGDLRKDDKITLAKLQTYIKSLEELQSAISEYRCELKDTEIELKDRARDSGISLGDRCSVLSTRDSYPVQECGDNSRFSTDLSNMATALPSEHDENKEDGKKSQKMTTLEKEVLESSGMTSVRNRRPDREQRVLIPDLEDIQEAPSENCAKEN